MAPSTRKPAGRARPRRAPEKKRRSIFWRWRRVFYIFGLLALAATSGVAYAATRIELPSTEPPDTSSVVCAADVPDGCNADNALARFHASVDRIEIDLDDVPQVHDRRGDRGRGSRLLPARRRRPDRHRPGAVAGPAGRRLRAGRHRPSPSSTCSTTYLTTERTVTRKLKEAVLAIKVEQELSKEEILERYLNTIYFGTGHLRRRRRGAGLLRPRHRPRSIWPRPPTWPASCARPRTATPSATRRRPPAAARRCCGPWSRRSYISEAEYDGRQRGAVDRRHPRGRQRRHHPPPAGEQPVRLGPAAPVRHRVLRRLRPPAAQAVRLHRRPDLRRRAADLHQPRSPGPAGGVAGGGLHPRPARRSAGGAGRGRQPGAGPGHDRRPRLRHQPGQPGARALGRGQRPRARVRR